MDLSIVVLTFNAKDVTLKMFSSLKESLDFMDKKTGNRITWEVIVVDNGSIDGVAEEVDENYGGWIKLVKQGNVGFAKGNNRGVMEASPDSRYILFLNPDITLDKDCIVKMYEYMESNADVGLSTCKVNLWSGGLDWDFHRGFPTPWRAFCYFSGLENILGKILPTIFGGYHLLEKDMNKEHEIDACLGAFMMVRRSVGDKVSWWPEEYFLNGEDVDFCYKIKAFAGSEIKYLPDTSITHYKGASKGTKSVSTEVSKASEDTKMLQINSGIEAMMIFYNKYYKDKYSRFITKLVFAGIWLLHKKRVLLKKE